MLEIKNLKAKSVEGKVIIENISFALHEKEMIRISGENGSGKTSLVNAIFKNPNYVFEGGVFLNGENITDIKTEEMIKKGMFLGLQFTPEIEGLNTLRFLHKAYKNIHAKNGDDISIIDFKNNLEKELEKYNLNKDFLARDLNYKYSGGERKIFTMITLLALKPKYIFLDEIDSGVDEDGVEKIYKIINDMRENNASAFCIISHNKSIKNYINFDNEIEIKNTKN